MPQRDIQHYMRPGLLQLSSLPPLSLYVHIPWCLRKCPYCDFNSHARDGGEAPTARAALPDALCADLKPRCRHLGPPGAQRSLVGHAQPVCARDPSTACWPTSARACRWRRAAKMTMEANPGTFRERPRFAPSPSGRHAPVHRACRASTTAPAGPGPRARPRPGHRGGRGRRSRPSRPSTSTSCTRCPARRCPSWTPTCAPRWPWRRRTCRCTT